VRSWMVGLQQALGRSVAGGIVMEGRDIGTVVFPEASLKVFLIASAEARAERRVAQGGGADAAEVLAALRTRDERDQSRAESPLRAAEDAVTLDSTELSLDAVTERVAGLVRERWGLSG
jgi:cytidylate kinase